MSAASTRPIATTRSTTGMPTGRLAVWWIIASEIVIFGGLLGSYVMHRLAHDAFADAAAHTNTWIGAFNTFVLLTSSLFAVLAHKAAEEHDGKTRQALYYAASGPVPRGEVVRVDSGSARLHPPSGTFSRSLHGCGITRA
jgi:heme/copper-type cytochrome/quinol oxidase subunit 3